MMTTMRPFVLVALLASCGREHASVLDAAPSPSPSPMPSASAPYVDPRLIPDEQVGPLIAKLSESPGDFPSDNFVTNETSLLDVAPALRNPALKGRAYVGVGPDQNLTYMALMQPALAYVVDIRRGNMLELMVFRGCFEVARTRGEFLSALLARRAPVIEGGSGFASLAAAFTAAPGEKTLRDEGVARTRALLERLRVVRLPADDDVIARIHDAFFTRGLALAYTMKNSGRKYPTLGEILAARDPSGAEASFLASDDVYARVRQMFVENRVLPLVGDFGGKHALKSVADDMRARGLSLGAFYTSNVEQYLFEQHTYGQFVANVSAMPRDDASLLVRVWFDQGKPHPAQRPGHRTTQLALAANTFLARAEKKPFGSYWEVVNQLP